MTGFEMSYTLEYLDQLGWADERAKLQDRIEELEKNLSYEVEQKIKLADTLRDERAKRPDREQDADVLSAQDRTEIWSALRLAATKVDDMIRGQLRVGRGLDDPQQVADAARRDRLIEMAGRVRDSSSLALEPDAREIPDAEVAAAYSAFVQASFGFPGAPAMRAALEASRDA